MSENNTGTKKRGILFHIPIILLCVCALFFFGVLAYRQAERSRILSEEHKNASSWSVDTSYEAEIGGITQYIRVKGDFSENPLLLIFPDYPGKLSASSSYMIPDGLEQRFVVVTWDMRGTGVTRSMNRETDEFSYKNVSDDAAEICDLVREKLGREEDKFYILGYSFGSVTAADFCRKYPSYAEAYFGVSQVCDLMNGMSSSIMKEAESSMLTSMKEFNRYMDAEKAVTDYGTMEQSVFYDTLELLGYGSSRAPTSYSLFVSPYCKLGDLTGFSFPNNDNEAFFRSFVEFDSQQFGYSFQFVPVVFICGSEDLITPADTLKKYVGEDSEAIEMIEGGGHELLFDNTDEVMDIIDRRMKQ